MTKYKTRVFKQRHGDKDHDLCDRCFRAQCYRTDTTPTTLLPRG